MRYAWIVAATPRDLLVIGGWLSRQGHDPADVRVQPLESGWLRIEGDMFIEAALMRAKVDYSRSS